MTGDQLNAFFEGFGALLIFTSVRQLLKDKVVKGFSPIPLMFWTAWGVFNVWYYPSLDQWLSFYAGLAVVAVNSVYLTLVLYYLRKQKRAAVP